MTKSITNNALYSVLLNISSVIFPLITAPYVSRVLGPDGVGLNSFAGTYAGYFALFALLGIPTYGVREVSKFRGDKGARSKLVSELMSIAAITTLFVSIVYLLSIYLVGQLNTNYIIFLIAGFSIYLAPFKVNWYYQGMEDFGFITLRSLIIRVISIVCLFLFVRDKDDLIIYVILTVAGGVAADIWNFIKLYNEGIRLHFTYIGLKSHLKPIMILFASSIAISIYTILDTIMLGFIKDYEEVGYYSYAMQMSKIVLTAVTSLSIVVVPRVSYYMKNRDYSSVNELMNKSFSVVTFLSFPAAIGLACISPIFIPLFFGEQFIGAVIPLMILSMLIIAIGLNNLTGVQILIGMGYDKLFLYSVLVGTLSNFILNCMFIPLWGGVGASIASVTAETLILIVTSYFVYKKTVVRITCIKDVGKAFLGSLIFIPLVYLLKSFLKGWFLVFAFVLFGTCIYILIEVALKYSSVALFKSIVMSKIQRK